MRSGEVQKEGGRTGSFGVGRKTPLGAMYQVMFKRGLVRRWKFPDSLTLRFQQPRLYNTYHDVFDLSSQKLSLPTNILEPSCCASSFRTASTLRSQHPFLVPSITFGYSAPILDPPAPLASPRYLSSGGTLNGP